MIDKKRVKTYCREDISLIENFIYAINDQKETWDCHHRRESIFSKNELIQRDEYFHRPAVELIFIKHSEHMRLHNIGKHLSKDTKHKIGKASKLRCGKLASCYGRCKDKHPLFGNHWYTNGTIELVARECPDGFVAGRLKKKSSEN